MPAGVEDALHASLQLTHELHHLRHYSGKGPLDGLAEVLGVDLRSARALADDPRVAGRAALLTGLDVTGIAQWDATLRAFISTDAKPTPYAALILAVIGPREVSLLKACGALVHSWTGVITRTDAMLAALGAIAYPENPLLDRLAVEIAVELCGWDLTGVVDQVAQRVHDRTDLFLVPSHKRMGADKPVWEHGSCDVFDGSPFATLEASESRELRRRVWRGQVGILFGWLEEVRLSFVSRVTRGRPNDYLLGCEWSELTHKLPSLSREELDFAERCRRLRNTLAHRNPVLWEDFTDLLFRARRLGLTSSNVRGAEPQSCPER